MSFFQKAEKRKAWLKLALTGPSGSGKTMSALKLAEGLANKTDWKIGLIDTEAKSASLYADKFSFFSGDIAPPYTIPKYIEAIDQAAAAGIDVLIIDSISHAWAGEGGLLSKKEAADARGGNSFANWAKITPEHEKFKGKLLNAQMHLICTMRSKQDYILESNDKGKQTPRKVGLAPVQREGMEYEFTTVFDVGMDHQATPSKDRTGLFDGQFFQIERKHGEILMKWLNASSGELTKITEVETKESEMADPSLNIPPGFNKAQAEGLLKDIRETEKKISHASHSVRAGNHTRQEDITEPGDDEATKDGMISKKQGRRLFAIQKDCKWTEEELRSLILRVTGQGSTSHIHWTKYDEIWKYMEANRK